MEMNNKWLVKTAGRQQTPIAIPVYIDLCDSLMSLMSTRVSQ